MKNSTAFILLILAGTLFYIFIRPEYDKVQALRAEALEYQTILSNVSDLKDKRDALLAKYELIPKADIDRINKVLPNNVDTVRLAMDFDTIAARYGISIKSIQTAEGKNDNSASVVQDAPTNKYESVDVTLNFASSYENFRKFMADIERSLRIIDTTTMSFETGETGVYDYKVMIKTYWLK